jgi:DNA processing protein
VTPDRLAVAFLGLHPERARQLVVEHGGPSRLLAAVRRGAITGISPDLVRGPDECAAALRECGVRAVYLGGEDYPVALTGIADPPDVLFVRGQFPASGVVAVVGTRRSTAYGNGLARGFGRAIAAAGWVLCSGLARGIDGAAHRGTIEAGGAGIAVMGSGPDIIYPREHRDLAIELARHGAVITEYPPGTPPHGWRFPPRNRIIAGLSRAVVVVEAGVTGGALVTAARAVEQGREVFAVPGDVDRASSMGCNLLIRDGAIPVLGPQDLVEALSLLLGSPRPTASQPAGALPPTGMTIDELGVRLGLQGPGLATWLGRAELEGRVRIEEGRVFPSGH